MKKKIFYFILCCFIFHSLRSMQGDKSLEQQEKFLSIKIQQQGKLMMETFILLGKKFFLASQVVGCGVLSLYMYKKGFGKSFFIPVVCSAVGGYLCWPKHIEMIKFEAIENTRADNSILAMDKQKEKELENMFNNHLNTDNYNNANKNEFSRYKFFTDSFIGYFTKPENRTLNFMKKFLSISIDKHWLNSLQGQKEYLINFIYQLEGMNQYISSLKNNDNKNESIVDLFSQSYDQYTICKSILEKISNNKTSLNLNDNEFYKKLYPYIINAIDDRDLRLFMCSKDLNEENKQVYKDLNVERGV